MDGRFRSVTRPQTGAVTTKKINDKLRMCQCSRNHFDFQHEYLGSTFRRHLVRITTVGIPWKLLAMILR